MPVSSVCFLFFLKPFIYVVFLSYRGVCTHVDLSEPAYTQVSLVTVAYTRILYISTIAYILQFSRFVNLFVSEGLSGGLSKSETIIFQYQLFVLQRASRSEFSLIIRSIGLVFFDCKRHHFWLKHARFLPRNLGCSVSSG